MLKNLLTKCFEDINGFIIDFEFMLTVLYENIEIKIYDKILI